MSLTYEELKSFAGDVNLALGGEVMSLDEMREALKARLMPEGMEWPRFEDGELVRFGDEAEIGSVSRVVNFVIFDWDTREWGVVIGGEGSKPGQRFGQRERVKRPPILAKDGEPIEVGDTVWRLDKEGNNTRDFPCEVRGFDANYVSGLKVDVKAVDGTVELFDPDRLTHTPPEEPDTWELLEMEAHTADLLAADEHAPICEADDRVLFVRRAKALAERGAK